MIPQEFLTRIREAGALAPAHKPSNGEHISAHLIHPFDQVISPDTGEVWLHPQLLRLFDAARERIGEPLQVNAGSRTVEHELELQRLGYKAAAFLSPHCLSALDISAHPIPSQKIIAALILCAENLGFPLPRIGHRAYNEAWVHVDLVFFFFQPYNPALPHPADWPELQDEVRRTLDASWRPGVDW